MKPQYLLTNRFFVLLFFALCVLSACGGKSTPEKPVTPTIQPTDSLDLSSLSSVFDEFDTLIFADGRYQMMIPEYFGQQRSLNEHALLQYGSEKRRFYLVVIRDSRYDLSPDYNALPVYYNFVNGRLAMAMTNIKTLRPSTLEIGGYAALKGEIRGTSTEGDFFYKIAVVQTKEHFYQLITWAPEENRATYTQEMDLMINSFEIINADTNM
ncbi:hypothetical protein [Eisenibacter elegans]|jgi:hypothetical protein|uniref:hypothetical protein n=1 Tax=Eisenibacter elegans TaxID=997 RepID=UPI00041E5FF9|nr:hypothetical protein [Eisenibacter elegans]